MNIQEGVRMDTLGLSEPILRAMQKKGIEVSTPVQAGCIPPMMAGKDVIAKAPTGTGKTFAFGLPILQHIDTAEEAVQAVILAPTRELALQTTGELRDAACFMEGVRIVCVYGGEAINKQIEQLKRRPQIVVATPGRLGDHIKRRTVRVDKVKTVILDEADRMLDMGFIKDVTHLLDLMKNRRNLGLFSATMSREVMDISWIYQRDPVEIEVQADQDNKPDILQFRMECRPDERAGLIAKLIEAGGLDRVMVFANTKGSAERAAEFLRLTGLNAQCIHGDIPQKKREAVMARFRRGELPVFVSTDVAARGIDVDDVDAVFNYDIPDENESYVHRIGRTGRAKKQGVAISFVADYPSRLRLNEIAKLTKNEIIPVRMNADGGLETV